MGPNPVDEDDVYPSMSHDRRERRTHPLSSAERSRLYRARKKAALEEAVGVPKPQPLSSAERCRLYRLRKKAARENGGISKSPTLSHTEYMRLYRARRRAAREKELEANGGSSRSHSLSKTEYMRLYRARRKAAQEEAVKVQDGDPNEQAESFSSAEGYRRYSSRKKVAREEAVGVHDSDPTLQVLQPLSSTERGRLYRARKKAAREKFLWANGGSSKPPTLSNTEYMRLYRARRKAAQEKILGANGGTLPDTEYKRLYRARKKAAQEEAARLHDGEPKPRPLSKAEYMRLYRARRKTAREEAVRVHHADVTMPVRYSGAGPSAAVTKWNPVDVCPSTSHDRQTRTTSARSSDGMYGVNMAVADRHFAKTFSANEFVHVCDVCDRLWFQVDVLQPVQNRHHDTLRNTFPEAAVEMFKVCVTCKRSLDAGKIPTMTVINGFREEPSCREGIDATTGKKRKCDPSSFEATFLGNVAVDGHPQFLFVDADAVAKDDNEYTKHKEKPNNNIDEHENICIIKEVKEEKKMDEPSYQIIELEESSLSDISTHQCLHDSIPKTDLNRPTSIKTEYTEQEQKLDVSDEENYFVKTEVKEEIEEHHLSLI